MSTDDTRPLPPTDETRPLPDTADETRPLPDTADETRPLPAAGETRPLPAAGETRPLATPSAGETRPLPTTSDDTRPPLIDDLAAVSSRDEPAQVEASTVAKDERAPRARLRVGTVVWGLVLAAIGVGILAWASGLTIDVQLALIVLLAVAGAALLVGSLVSAARSSRR